MHSPENRPYGWTLIAYVIFVFLVLHRPKPRDGLGVPFPCQVAVQIDGVLKCDDAILHHLAEACGPRWCREEAEKNGPIQVGATWIVAGDEMMTPEVCDWLWNQKGNLSHRMSSEDLRGLEVRINVNAASEPDLESFSGIGPVLAARISMKRPFRSPDDLLAVRGIGEKKLEKMRNRLRLDWSSDSRLILRREELCRLYDER